MWIQDMKYITDLNSTATQHDIIHLFKCQCCCFGQVILDECKTLVFVGDSVPRQANILDGAKRLECLFHGVLTDVEAYTTNVYTVHTPTHIHYTFSSNGLQSYSILG